MKKIVLLAVQWQYNRSISMECENVHVQCDDMWHTCTCTCSTHVHKVNARLPLNVHVQYDYNTYTCDMYTPSHIHIHTQHPPRPHTCTLTGPFNSPLTVQNCSLHLVLDQRTYMYIYMYMYMYTNIWTLRIEKCTCTCTSVKTWCKSFTR